MLMTEEQARTKWCPHAHPGADSHKCIASGCMAWRTGGHPRETIRNYQDAPSVKRIVGSFLFHTYEGGWQYVHTDTDQDGRQFDLLHRIASEDAPALGYCGAFGKAEG